MLLLHVWDFSLVEKVEYLSFHIILTKLRSSQSNDNFRGCRDFPEHLLSGSQVLHHTL